MLKKHIISGRFEILNFVSQTVKFYQCSIYIILNFEQRKIEDHVIDVEFSIMAAISTHINDSLKRLIMDREKKSIPCLIQKENQSIYVYIVSVRLIIVNLKNVVCYISLV